MSKNPRQKPLKTPSQGTPGIIQPLLGRHVKVKAVGHIIEGRLVHADFNHEYYGLGNLILEDNSIIHCKLVESICIERGQTR